MAAKHRRAVRGSVVWQVPTSVVVIVFYCSPYLLPDSVKSPLLLPPLQVTLVIMVLKLG